MVRRSQTIRKQSRKKKGPGVSVGLLAFLLIASFSAVAAWLVLSPAGPEAEIFVEIAPGSTSGQIAAQLEKAGVVRSRYAFELVRIWKRGRLKAGEYRFDHPAPVPEVYARIARGDVFTVAVTIPEGATRFDIAARFAQAGFPNIDRNRMLTAIQNETSLIADLDSQASSLEGYLFPDTYRFPRNATAGQVVAAMVRRFRSVAAQLGLLQNPAQSKRSLHNLVTLASLVERETAVDAERPMVASVLGNRLRKEMPLMTDPALIYGLELAGKWRGAIYQSDLKDPAHDTPYNTYRHAGLPPGPIANPGLPSLRAALHPAATDYLYFVAAGGDPQGKSRFATTLDEHNKNVVSYRQAIRHESGKQVGGR